MNIIAAVFFKNIKLSYKLNGADYRVKQVLKSFEKRGY